MLQQPELESPSGTRNRARADAEVVAPVRVRRSIGALKGVLRLTAFGMVLVVALIATHLVVERGLRRIETSTFGVFNRIVDGRINAEVLVTGSSRALNHFDPRIIEQRTGKTSFNIGIDGSQTDMQVAVLKTYLAHNTAPELVIHSLDSFAFVTSREGMWFTAQYLPYLDETPIYHALAAVNPDIWRARRLPLYGYVVEDMNFTWSVGLRGFFGWNPSEDRYAGFLPRRSGWTDEFARFRSAHHGTVRFSVDPQGVRDFEELMSVCTRHGVPVLLVYSPVYYEMQALETNRAELFERFRVIAAKFGSRIWDYSASQISRRKDYFVNSQHMNAEGAEAFSRELADTLAQTALLRR